MAGSSFKIARIYSWIRVIDYVCSRFRCRSLKFLLWSGKFYSLSSNYFYRNVLLDILHLTVVGGVIITCVNNRTAKRKTKQILIFIRPHIKHPVYHHNFPKIRWERERAFLGLIILWTTDRVSLGVHLHQIHMVYITVQSINRVHFNVLSSTSIISILV